MANPTAGRRRPYPSKKKAHTTPRRRKRDGWVDGRRQTASRKSKALTASTRGRLYTGKGDDEAASTRTRRRPAAAWARRKKRRTGAEEVEVLVGGVGEEEEDEEDDMNCAARRRTM